MATKKAPTAAETRKAFRAAVDAIDLPPEARRIALEAFKTNLWSSVPNKRNRRQEQNQALRDIQTLAEILPDLLEEATHVIKRNDYTSGQRKHEPGELGANPNKPGQVDMTGTPPPYSGDPTGEEACWDELDDRTGKIISAMCVALGDWLTMAKSIHDLSNIDVRERAVRNIPDCRACGQPIEGRVISLYDRSCYNKWVWYRSSHPDADKHQFEREMKERLAQESVTNEISQTSN